MDSLWAPWRNVYVKAKPKKKCLFCLTGKKQKSGMSKMAEVGRLQTRPPLGYDVMNGNLTPNEDAVRVHSLFKTYLGKIKRILSESRNDFISCLYCYLVL